MKKTKKAIALVLAGTVMCGCFVGCDLVTKDTDKDLAQVIATVDITRSSEFEKGGMYEDYKGIASETKILKRDMLAYYQDVGYAYKNNYGKTYAETFQWICDRLTVHQLDVQYAMIYFVREGVTDENGEPYTKEGFNAAVEAGKKAENELAGIAYFLTPEEEARALYSTKRLFNNTLDSFEPEFINSEEDDSSSAEQPRTLPTGVETANSDYFDADYQIYTGKNKPSDCGSYEALDNSTATSRKRAYKELLERLSDNNLLSNGENTNEIEKLDYFQYELKSSYESAIISKLADEFEKKAESEIAACGDGSTSYMESYYNSIYTKQKEAFGADSSAFEASLDGISNDTFLLTAPEAGYGYVINILLPFNALQSAQVKSLKPDAGDVQGNYFKQRAAILEKLKATDQRGSWFTGEKDYSFEGTGYTGGSANRTHLFFEDSLKAEENSEYERMKNYYGQYTYNGEVHKNDDGTYELTPNKITIDDFIVEMEGYLASAGLQTSTKIAKRDGYYTQSSYYDRDDVDYSKFVYYAGSVNFGKTFDANRMFVADEPENKAFSIINELSFAYNTDTGGLNPYLGYSIVTGKTSFVSEFEYAAQEACKSGAGTYYIVPSDYGWHIIYCTFSFTEAFGKPFVYSEAEKETEGTFSYYFYESMKADYVSTYSDNRQNMIANVYNDCKTVYEKAYKDLLELNN